MIVTILQGIVDCTVLYIPSYPTVIDIAFSFLTSAQLVSMDLLCPETKCKGIFVTASRAAILLSLRVVKTHSSQIDLVSYRRTERRTSKY
jgi:hypothetical protein